MCCHHFSAFFTVADIPAPFFLCPPIEDFSEEALPISSYVEYSVTNAPGSLIWDINAELEALFDTDPRATSVHPCRQRTVLLAPPLAFILVVFARLSRLTLRNDFFATPNCGGVRCRTGRWTSTSRLTTRITA